MAILLSGMTCLAVAGASLLYPGTIWASLLPLIEAALLLAALVGVILSRGANRAYWIGFAVFGWGYLILIYGPYSDEHRLSNYPFHLFRPAFDLSLKEGAPVNKSNLPAGTYDYIQSGNKVIPRSGVRFDHFMGMVNFHLSVLFGLVGSQVAVAVYRSANSSDKHSPETTAT